MSLMAQAAAKVNLTLDILGRRPDGYHELRMVMQAVSLCDTVTVEEGDSGFALLADGFAIPAGKKSLEQQAAEAFFDAVGQPMPIFLRIHLVTLRQIDCTTLFESDGREWVHVYYLIIIGDSIIHLSLSQQNTSLQEKHLLYRLLQLFKKPGSIFLCTLHITQLQKRFATQQSGLYRLRQTLLLFFSQKNTLRQHGNGIDHIPLSQASLGIQE